MCTPVIAAILTSAVAVKSLVSKNKTPDAPAQATMPETMKQADSRVSLARDRSKRQAALIGMGGTNRTGGLGLLSGATLTTKTLLGQ